MSICNGAAKKAKKNNVISKMVHPIQHANTHTSNPDVANSPPFVENVIRGQLIAAQTIQEPTIVAELVHEVIPQGSSTNKDVEPIQWVKIQSCSYSSNPCTKSFVILMGLARGYQIWLARENGLIEEVISERKGPLKVGHLLPCLSDDSKDMFYDKRPLLALVDGNPLTSDNKFSCVSFLSLKMGNTVHTLEVNAPIIELESSRTCFLVLTTEAIVVCDQHSLSKRHSINIPLPHDALSFPTFALSDNLLAFLDTELHKNLQSCGGLLIDEGITYSGQIISAAKSLSKTVSSLGESVVSSFTSSSQLKSATSFKDSVVTIADVTGLVNGNTNANSNNHIRAHFVAHEEPIGFLSFGTGGQLLLACSQSSKTFHLYSLNFHTGTSSLGSVQHLYTLHRGNSAAKVIDCAFSSDNRWLAVATNHGTTHVFAINPYGGPATSRTHGGKLVNKESRFERTAGLTSHDIPRSSPKLPNISLPITFKEHPALGNSILSRTSINPWIRNADPPLFIYSVAQIKQRPFSAERVTAWASDNVSLSTSTNRNSMRLNGNQWLLESNRRQAVAFLNTSLVSTSSDGEPLFIMNADGILSTYELVIKRERYNSGSSISSLNNISEILSSSPKGLPVNINTTKSSYDMPVIVKVIAISQWSLLRPRGSTGVEPPLLEVENYKSKNKDRKNKPDNWIRHIEGACYSGPHRRIWMGPQFSFGVYTSSHSSAQLFNPNDTHGIVANIQKCCPVLIEKNSSYSSLSKCDTSFDYPSRIICGSWSSESDFKSNFDDSTMFEVKEKLEDAMKETTHYESSGSIKNNNRDSGNDQDLLNISGMDL